MKHWALIKSQGMASDWDSPSPPPSAAAAPPGPKASAGQRDRHPAAVAPPDRRCPPNRRAVDYPDQRVVLGVLDGDQNSVQADQVQHHRGQAQLAPVRRPGPAAFQLKVHLRPPGALGEGIDADRQQRQHGQIAAVAKLSRIAAKASSAGTSTPPPAAP